jgi:drug/metabolite transporter (DMT)-like permease
LPSSKRARRKEAFALPASQQRLPLGAGAKAFPNSAALAREISIPPVDPRNRRLGSAGLRAGLILIALSWGFNWPAVKLALNEMPIWSMRAVGLTAGSLLLLGLAKASGRSLEVAARQWPALILAGLLNVTAFNVLTAVAQTLMPTSRAVILAYTMPLWTALLARIFLGEVLTPRQRTALVLGGAGLAAVLAPLRSRLGEPAVEAAIAAILGAAIAWAAGTIVMKRAGSASDPLVNTIIQLGIGAISVWVGAFAFEATELATLSFWPKTWAGWGGLLYNSVIGIALSYFLWFGMVARLPAATAAIGVLLVPVVGVTAAMAIIGERPSLADGLGFLLISAAVFINARQQPA